ncbi:hypothetical protein HII31_04402 [Pseudocercospora fuligena]|uniref:DUF221-domain-containing protein n=1 Tax=Pseudocercospora fuligena TaxID=685502 RepID=A0A8H6VN78_9PEZI|nr:hypothetical protein HII31_04402 [Pseudocercospora fuligena]
MDTPQPTCTGGGLLGVLTCGSGQATQREGQTVNTLAASLVSAFASLGIQVLAFMLLRLRLSRIYRPKSYLVPERERVAAPPGGLVGWLYPLFTTTNLGLIQKCGLDAYFFLRFLRMLLKIFFPATLLALPILLPLNHNGGGDSKGLDKYSISNIAARNSNRLWAHLILGIIFILWTFYIVFKELRGYIRVRQAFLTSPQHRIRASATTVLVTGIPRKWLTMEALSGLYDVFPGGIRNIWINRNYDELNDKVKYRDKIARSLEDAETVLIKNCRKKHIEAEQKKAKEDGKKKSKEEKRQDKAEEDAAAERMAQSEGVSAGENHEISQGLQDTLEEEEQQHANFDKRRRNPFGLVGEGVNAVGHGFKDVGKGIGKFGDRVVGGVDNGFHKAEDDFNLATRRANAGGGFSLDDDLYRVPSANEAGAKPPRAPLQEAQAKLDAMHHNKEDRAERPSTSDTRPRQTRHPFAASPNPADGESPISDRTLDVPDIHTTRRSGDTKPKSSMQIEEPAHHKASRNSWNIFKNNDKSLIMPSPQPHIAEDDDEFPLHSDAEKKESSEPEDKPKGKSFMQKLAFWKKDDDEDDENKEEYPNAIDKDWDEDQDEEPYWRRYLEPTDRETIRLPLFSPTWFPSIPLVGKKVDRIYHLRRELARLNLEIEEDQNNIEKFPYMNSAFIQFNHQVAAHMCCQSLSHHIPQHMAPRLVEISPEDVIWDNMSVKWWERYLRTGLILLLAAGLIVFYAIPVAFTSLLNKVSELASYVSWLAWLTTLPGVVISIIQGVLPPVLLSLILLLVPIIFRFLIKQQGVPTGNDRERGVQSWYFAFLFIQVFLVVTISGGLIALFQALADNPTSIVTKVASNIPTASNYFFSYLTVQALSNSASALLQLGSLFGWFILAPMLDSTARQKWKRQTNLQNVTWGTFFPPFTNFAVIGMIYSIVSPLILVFMIFIFALFWIVYRYNVLFVYQFKHDTGGLLFPVAINQLFTGIYFLEIAMIGYFFTLQHNGTVVCLPQAIIMIVMLVLTVLFQWLTNMSFKPLFQYLPITLEDEAVIRDEQFAKAQESKFAPLNESGNDERDVQDMLEDREQAEENADRAAIDEEKRVIGQRRSHTPGSTHSPDAQRTPGSAHSARRGSHWAKKSEAKPAWGTELWKKAAPEAVARLRYLADGKPMNEKKTDAEAQHTVGDVLFSGYADELEDLTPDERDLLVRYAFQHSALRARRPVVWIPRDQLGVSDDEIKRAKKMSTVAIDGSDRTNIWMSNEGTALDGKGRVVFRRSPPDFSNVDLIAL